MIGLKERYLFLIVLVAFFVEAGCGEASKKFPGIPYVAEDNENTDSPAGPVEPVDVETSIDTVVPIDNEEPIDTVDIEGPDTEPSTSELGSCFAPDYVAPIVESGEKANVGEECGMTADCLKPLFCLDGNCTAPGPWENYCDGINVQCQDPKRQCVNFQCVDLNDGCWSHFDCPSGYDCVCDSLLCQNPRCHPIDEECDFDTDCADSEICDFGSCTNVNQCSVQTDLRGTFSGRSTLHLGLASDSTIGEILSATQWIRDLLEGNGTFPGLSDMLSVLIRNFLMYGVDSDQLEVVMSLPDLFLILDEFQLQYQITMDASCSELYRGETTIEQLIVTYQGQEYATRPEDIPSIGALPPVDFSASLHCGTLAIDAMKIDHMSSGAVRYASEVLVKAITQGRYEHLEDVLLNLVDCAAIANYVSTATRMPPLAAVIQTPCRWAVEVVNETITQVLADNPSDAGWIELQGEVDVSDDWKLQNGHWSGRTSTAEFAGEFSGEK